MIQIEAHRLRRGCIILHKGKPRVIGSVLTVKELQATTILFERSKLPVKFNQTSKIALLYCGVQLPPGFVRFFEVHDIDVDAEESRIKSPGLYQEHERKKLLALLKLVRNGELRRASGMMLTWPREIREFVGKEVSDILFTYACRAEACITEKQAFTNLSGKFPRND